VLVTADFFTVEVWTRNGVQRFMVLFFIELSTRKVEIAGITSVANGLWMTQVARSATDPIDGFLKGKRYLIHDRDPLYTAEFLTMLEGVGVKSVRLPARSPNLNPYAERFVRSIKESCLDRMILFGEASLRTAIKHFVAHHHSERNHQGLANRVVLPESGPLESTGGRAARGGRGGDIAFFKTTASGEHWMLATDDTRVFEMGSNGRHAPDNRPMGRIGGGDLPTVTVDLKDEHIVYSCSTVFWRTDDAGFTWSAVRAAPGGDDYQKSGSIPTTQTLFC
jgi:hypothetical protein